MKKSIALVLGIIFLLVGASVSIGASVSQTQTPMKEEYRNWSDNFDTYETGSQLHGQGGWAGWDNNAAATGYVSDTQALSSPNSAEISWFTTVAADMVQQYSGIDTGIWIYKAYQYVPSTMTGTQFFILMNTYTPGGAHNSPDWSLQLEFSASGGFIRDFNNPTATLTLVPNAWKEIRVEIDFDTDVQNVYYDNTLFITKSWKNGVAQGGAQNLACVDLYGGDAASTSVFYDDMSVAPPGPPLTCDADGPYSGFVGDDVQFTGTASGGTEPYSWHWDFGDGNSSSDQNPTYAYSAPGDYTVTLTVTDAVSGTATDTTVANIGEAQEPELQIVKISGGIGVSVILKNIGNADATNIQWTMNFTGFVFPKSKPGTIANLIAGQQTTIKVVPFGLGKTTIGFKATCAEGESVEQSTAGKVFFIFVTI